MTEFFPQLEKQQLITKTTKSGPVSQRTFVNAFKHEGTKSLQRCKPMVTLKNKKSSLELDRQHLKKPQRSRKKMG